MARKDRKDRGLVSKPIPGTKGKVRWYVRLFHEGREQWFGSFPAKVTARQFYDKAKSDQALGRFFPEKYRHGGYAKLADVIDGYMATNTNKSKVNDRRYAAYWKERFRDDRLNAVTPVAVEQAKLAMLGAGLTSQTVLHYLKFLRHVLNVAVRDGQLECNPMVKVGLPTVSKGRLRFLSLEEEAVLCEALGPIYALWVRFAVLTGLRRAEQFHLKWADIDEERGIVTLPRTKAGGVQYVHLSQEALRVVEELKAGNASVWVFPSQNQDSPVDTNNFYGRVYAPAVKATGFKDVTWHTLRHTFASRLAMSGATESELAAALRHSGTSLVRRYVHLSQAHQKGLMEKVSAFGKPVTNEENVSQVDQAAAG